MRWTRIFFSLLTTSFARLCGNSSGANAPEAVRMHVRRVRRARTALCWNSVQDLVEKPQKKVSDLVNIGVYFLPKSIFNLNSSKLDGGFFNRSSDVTIPKKISPAPLGSLTWSQGIASNWNIVLSLLILA